jgi:GntR family transcriptional regulator of arabinose operon
LQRRGIAFNLIAELKNRNIFVPDNISVIGIDDAEIASLCEVPITTVINPVDELGKILAQNILHLISNPSFNATVNLKPELAVRSSVKRLK